MPEELGQELERLAAQAALAREHIAGLRQLAAQVCVDIAAVRASSGGDMAREGTPTAGAAQGEAERSD